MTVSIEEVVLRYRQRLFALALSICRDPCDADDAVQNTLLRCCEKPREFDSEEHLRAWLLRVTINGAKDIAASFWRTHRLSLEDYTETLAFEAPEDRGLFEAVMALPQKYRTVLHLYYYEDYSVREIAQVLHIGENTVKTRLRRAREKLRQTLGEEWNDDE